MPCPFFQPPGSPTEFLSKTLQFLRPILVIRSRGKSDWTSTEGSLGEPVMHWTKIRAITLLVMALFAAKIATPSVQQDSKALTSAAAATSSGREPSVVMLPTSSSSGPTDSIPLPLEKTQLSQTKPKASSLGGLANDSMTTQALQMSANTLAIQGMTHGGGSMLGGIAAGEAGSVLGSAMLHRKPTVTYLWAVQGASSAIRANSNQPRFW